MKRALFSGSFDPITNGHIEIIEKAATLFDEVYVVIFDHPSKKSVFSIDERKSFIKESTKNLHEIIVDSSHDLAVNYAKEHDIQYLVRGLRNTIDFEYEKNLEYCNDYLEDNIQTVYFMSSPNHVYYSSTYVKEIASYNRSVDAMVPPCVSVALKDYFSLK